MQINFKNEMDRILREKMEGKSGSNHSIKDIEVKAVDGTGKVDTPPAFKQTEFSSSYESRLNQTPSPNNKTVSFEGQRGETKCILKPPPDPDLKKILDEAGIDGINYKNGVPDFSPVAKAQLEIDHMVGGVGSNGTKARAANFKQADIKLAEQLNNSPELASQFGLTPGKIKAGDIADIREELKLTWHELNDGKTIQLVPSEINSKFGHLGGVGEINAGAFEPGRFANK
ncbi:HNH endonuclease [Paenibacillus odorifer]|uniref:HNH endonuclease n=1 Tax=Paenibacillus odorifer TaxID=189426 RepID=UPI0009D65D05